MAKLTSSNLCAMATDDSEWWGAKWGAILHQYKATLGPLKRSIYLRDLAFSHGQQQPATAWPSFSSRGVRVQIRSAPPRSRAGSDYWIGPFQVPYSTGIQQRQPSSFLPRRLRAFLVFADGTSL